jgi:hypothetical protein
VTHRWLGLALYAEGETDHRFLDEVLRRSVEERLLGRGHSVEVPAMQRLTVDATATNRADRIANGCDMMQGAFHLLFVHADGGGDPDLARIERTDPGIELVLERLGDAARAGVPVVPVRETEAWALADYDTLRSVLATRCSNDELGLPRRSRMLEGVEDPKALFDNAVRVARGGRRHRRRASASAYLDLLGARVDVSTLAALPGFARLLADIDAALDRLGLNGGPRRT